MLRPGPGANSLILLVASRCTSSPRFSPRSVNATIDDPAQGVVEGREFLHPDLRLRFSVPSGYGMQNGTAAVSISGNGGQAQFSTAPYSGDMNAYIASVFRAATDGTDASASAQHDVTEDAVADSWLDGAAAMDTRCSDPDLSRNPVFLRHSPRRRRHRDPPDRPSGARDVRPVLARRPVDRLHRAI